MAALAEQQQCVQRTSNVVPQPPEFFVDKWERIDNGQRTGEFVVIDKSNNVFTLTFGPVFGDTLGGLVQTADFRPVGETGKGLLELREEEMTIGGFVKIAPDDKKVKALEARFTNPDVRPEEWDAEEDEGGDVDGY